MDQVVSPPPLAVEDVDLGGLAGSLGFLLRLAQVENFARFYEAFAGEELRPGEFSTLAVIHRNPGIRQGVLAQKLMIKRAHMTKLVRGFEDRGLVRRTIPDDDRRSVELALTAKGRAFVEANLQRFLAFETENAPQLSGAEKAELLRLLRKLTDV